MNNYPAITVQNQLTVDCVIYDAFQGNSGSPPGADDFFGTLTPLATLAPGASQTIAPIHGPISTYLVYDMTGAPVAREFTLGGSPATFVIGASDTARIAATGQFVDFITAHPGDPLATAFAALLTAAKPAAGVTAFFKAHAPYQSCTFVSYMMVIAARAKAAGCPVQSATYSLAALCNYLGGSWPPGFPDIEVSNFTCSDTDDTLILGGDLDVRNLPYASGCAGFIQSLLPDPCPVHATFQFHYGFDAGIFGTSIQFRLPSLALPEGVHLNNPTISLAINPLFKFVVFTAKAAIPFSLFGDTFTANASMTIDNLEAEVGVVIDGNSSSLMTPPVMKGVHFDQFGVGMGVFFDPPSYAIGVQGKFHIGENGGLVALDDDTFVVVCNLEGDVPNPLYISFYVPKMELGEIITIFTDANVDLGLPVTVTDLSFKWVENPMEPVTLPDGTLTRMAYGFSGQLAVLGWSFYGDMELDADTGVRGMLTSAPITLGPLKLAGDGPGVTIRIDANGNPIKNNQLATTKAIRDAIAHAGTRQLVAPGGPWLKVSTFGSLYLGLSARISLFDVIGDGIEASIAADGITFDLEYGSPLHTNIRCKLTDFHNFSGSFTYGLDASIPLPTIAGFSLGSLSLNADCMADLGIATSTTDVSMSVGVAFIFEGLDLRAGPFPVDIDIGSIGDLLHAIETYLIDHAADIFSAIIGDAGRWAREVAEQIVTGVTDIASGLKTAFGKTIGDTAKILSQVGYDVNQAAQALRNAFGTGASDVADALKGAYGDASSDIALALRFAGYGIGDISQALSTVFGFMPDAINTALQGIGYGVDDIKNAFESLGGQFSDFASSAWDTVSHDLNPGNW